MIGEIGKTDQLLRMRQRKVILPVLNQRVPKRIHFQVSETLIVKIQRVKVTSLSAEAHQAGITSILMPKAKIYQNHKIVYGQSHKKTQRKKLMMMMTSKNFLVLQTEV